MNEKQENTETTPIRLDDPLWMAWTEYKKTEDYANSLRWAAVGGDATIGSMWTMFCAGWNARSLPELPAPVETCETCETRNTSNISDRPYFEYFQHEGVDGGLCYPRQDDIEYIHGSVRFLEEWRNIADSLNEADGRIPGHLHAVQLRWSGEYYEIDYVRPITIKPEEPL